MLRDEKATADPSASLGMKVLWVENRVTGRLQLLGRKLFSTVGNQYGNAVDDWIRALAGDADEVRRCKPQIASTGRTGKLAR